MQQADVLIIADEDKLYGIEKNYYPDIKSAVDAGNLIVLPYDSWRQAGLKLKSNPRLNGEDVYIRNPYSNCFIPVTDKEILDRFIDDKSVVIKEALVWMGAKDIVLVENITDKDTVKSSLDAGAKASAEKGTLKVDLSRLSKVDIKTKIESHDPNRSPKSIEKVEAYLMDHGLADETKLTTLADRLREDGCINGTERYTVTYLNEIEFALNVLVGFDYKVFSSSLDFSLEHTHLHTIERVLDITF